MYYVFKVLLTTVLVVLISEIAKRSALIGAIFASVPLISVLAIIWLYIDTRDVGKVSDLSSSIVWLVLPSLVLFIVLPLLLQAGWNFYLALLSAMAAMWVSYAALLIVLKYVGINL